MAPPVRSRGFTLIELVAVMIVVGVLAAVAIPRLANTDFRERGFHDAAVGAIAHARRVAVASRRFVCVRINETPGTVSVWRDPVAPETVTTASCLAGGTALVLPAAQAGCDTNAVCAPPGVTLNNGAAASLVFDPLGRSVTAAKAVTGTVTLASGYATITVYPETGFVQ